MRLYRADSINSLFVNMNKSNLYKLQKVQNAAARLVARKNKRHSASKLLKDLHWLNVEARIFFKIMLIVYKCVNGICSRNLQIRYKGYNCRTSDYLLLETKKVKTNYGQRCFDYVGPRLWNALPLKVRMLENIETFKRNVKTILFKDCEGFKQSVFKYN